MQLHLFSIANDGSDLRWMLEPIRGRLKDPHDTIIAYLPLGSLFGEKWLEPTRESFKGVGKVELVNTETMELPEMEGILRRAALVYLPDGNACLLNHRLHLSRLLAPLRQKIQHGLPVLASGAGAVVCGPNILTSGDLNMVPTPHFGSLEAIPFNFHVHYEDQAERDGWLADYHSFHDNPVILLEDGAYLKVEGKAASLVRGAAWCWRAGKQKERLTAGEPISVH
jgi:peptidase E